MSEQPEPQEEKRSDHLQMAKNAESGINLNNTSAAGASIANSLIFLAEQLAEQNKLLARIADRFDDMLERGLPVRVI